MPQPRPILPLTTLSTIEEVRGKCRTRPNMKTRYLKIPKLYCSNRHGKNYLNQQKRKFFTEFTQIKYEEKTYYYIMLYCQQN
jgi:hypothetical protein